MNLKPGSIYTLPDGYELVARRNGDGGYLLYDPLKGVAAAPAYIVASSGELLSWNRRTSWNAADLQDTGRASPTEIERLVLL